MTLLATDRDEASGFRSVGSSIEVPEQRYLKSCGFHPIWTGLRGLVMMPNGGIVSATKAK